MSRIKSSLSRQTLLDCFIFVPSWEHRSEKRREKVIDTAQATTFGVSFTGAAKQRHCHCAVVQRQLDNSRYTTRDSHSTSHSGSFVLKQNKFDRTPLPIQSRGMFSLSVVRESELVAHQIRNSPLRGSNWQISGGETRTTRWRLVEAGMGCRWRRHPLHSFSFSVGVGPCRHKAYKCLIHSSPPFSRFCSTPLWSRVFGDNLCC